MFVLVQKGHILREKHIQYKFSLIYLIMKVYFFHHRISKACTFYRIKKDGVICTLSSHAFWCVVLIPLFSPYFIERHVWNEIKVSFSKHYDILCIFKWIFCKLEIIENRHFKDILLKYCTRSTYRGKLYLNEYLYKVIQKIISKFQKILSKTFRTLISP